MSRDVEDLFAGIRTADASPRPASSVRARGEARRRTTAVTVTAAVAAVAVGVFTWGAVSPAAAPLPADSVEPLTPSPSADSPSDRPTPAPSRVPTPVTTTFGERGGCAPVLEWRPDLEAEGTPAFAVRAVGGPLLLYSAEGEPLGELRTDDGTDVLPMQQGPALVTHTSLRRDCGSWPSLWAWNGDRFDLVRRPPDDRGPTHHAYNHLSTNGELIAWGDDGNFEFEQLVWVLGPGSDEPHIIGLGGVGSSDLAMAPDGRIALTTYPSPGEPARELRVVNPDAAGLSGAIVRNAADGCVFGGVEWAEAGLVVQEVCGLSGMVLWLDDSLETIRRVPLGERRLATFDADADGRLVGFLLTGGGGQASRGELVVVDGDTVTPVGGEQPTCDDCLGPPLPYVSWWSVQEHA